MKKQIQTEGALFQAVQLSGVFGDSKTFPDARALHPPEAIEAAFKALLEDFVRENFQVPGEPAQVEFKKSSSLAEHIDNLWQFLERPPADGAALPSSLIPLPYPYVVPGGRFREIYYWDSYFTCEGLAAAGRMDLVESMVRNFAWLVEQYGHIPNGNRTYYLSRSQPPFFWKMLQLLERERGQKAISACLPAMEAEYRFWAARQVAGTGLAHFWDERNTPREEAYREDVTVFERARPAQQGEIYRHLRAAAESGWDFSSRWLADGQTLESIHTTDLLPVDLNSLLYGMEQQMSAWRTDAYHFAAETRKTALQNYCWNEAEGWFFDFDWRAGQQTGVWSLAGAYPLYCGLASAEQAQRMAQNIAEKFLKPGGVVTTLQATSQQWDAPNGWAPLQWIVVEGLRNYGHESLAREIARRFVALAEKVYLATGKMMEKYNVCDLALEAGGGEYPLQDGFGWTNGVVRSFLNLLKPTN
jgi:alpha,alpha-trehalase